MKKVLLITYAFSPQSTPESILSAKIFAKLNNTKVDVVTIRCPIPGNIDLDPSLEGYIKKNFNTIYECKLNLFFKIISFLGLKKLFPFPDYYRVLNNKIYQYIIDNINVRSYDCVVTWSQSHSIHLVGLRLNKHFNLNNWVAYFSDPWSDNPFFNKSYFGMEKLSNLINEKKVLKQCNKAICTSIETKKLIQEKYSQEVRNKIFVIPHCFENELYPKTIKKTKKNKKIIFRYVGRFYGKRFPFILIKALKIIEKQDVKIFNSLNFEVYGAQNSIVSLRLNLNKKYLNFCGPLSYFNSLKIMKTADYLLVIDAPFKNSVFFPSKLVDYMGSKTPVLGITPKGTARDIIKKMGGYSFSFDNEKILAKQILNLIKNKDKNKINSKYINQFRSDHVRNLFLKVLYQ